jgi:hypothetical protein
MPQNPEAASAIERVPAAELPRAAARVYLVRATVDGQTRYVVAASPSEGEAPASLAPDAVTGRLRVEDPPVEGSVALVRIGGGPRVLLVS